MVEPASLNAIAAALSGLLLILLGVPLLVLKPRRVASLAFGAFAILWGAQVIFGNLSRLVGDPRLASRFTFLFLAPLVVLYVPLTYFASTLTARRGLVARSPLAGALLLAPALVGAAALLFAPSLLHDGFDAEGNDRWGILYPAFTILFYAAAFYAAARLTNGVSVATSPIEGKRLLAVLGALGIFVSYASVKMTILFGMPLARGAGWDAMGAIFVALGLSGVGIIAWAWRRLRRSPHARGATLLSPSRWIPVSATAGAVGGLTLAIPGLPAIDPLGLVRTASVVLIAYAILRFELFDIDVKLKRGVIAGAILVGAALVALAVEQGLERVLGSTGLAITLTQFTLVGAVVAVVMKAPSASRALAARVLPSIHAPDRLDARRLEVYEAALSQAAASGGIHAQDAFLADLRARLGVSDAEHQLLARLVSGSARPGAAEPLAPGAPVAGRYRVERLLGEGSAGAAWLALDETLRRRVVLKALHARLGRSDAASRAFLREARVLASLDHENVVRVHDFGYHGDCPYLVLELVEGGSLHERIEREGALRPAEAARLVAEVLDGLAHVHARGILHRDLKPANVLLTRDGRPKIADFGIATGDDPHATMQGLEAPGPRGTPATMSPEAVRNLPVTPASDIYGAGALLYQLLTGGTYLSFVGKTRAEAHRAIVEDPPRPAPPGTDARLVGVALRALAKDPAERFASAEEMREALARAPVPAR